MKRIYAATVKFSADGLQDATDKLEQLDDAEILVGPDEVEQTQEDEDEEEAE